MTFFSDITFRYLFKAFCTVCLLCMVWYWFYKFIIEDRNIGTVDYITFKNDLNIKYPVASLCFAEPILARKVAENYPDLNKTSYMEYLEGDIFDETFAEVDYSNITIDLDEYYEYTWVFLRNKTRQEGSQISSFVHKISFNGISEWDEFYKCIELNWDTNQPDIIKERFAVYNKTAILRDLSGSLEFNFDLYMHYPGQFLLAPNDLTEFIMDVSTKSLVIKIEDVEILRSRDSRNKRCTAYNDKLSFDEMVKEKHILTTGCSLPYFGAFKNFPKCDTREKIKQSSYSYQEVRTKYYPISCQRLSKISFTTHERETVDDLDFDKDEWAIGVSYRQNFRAITLSKEVDIHSLIGNVGGYVGLFLGN